MQKIVAISDVHGKWNSLTIPECDILISAGDYSFRGEPHMVRDFHKWLNKQDARYVISVQGNHELWVEKNFTEAKKLAEEACPGVYFIDEGLIEIEGLKIWGSAITPWFYDWAWNRHRGNEIKQHWNKIPANIDIVITHGPVYGILDKTPDTYDRPGTHVGCEELLLKLQELKPKIHICGHIHDGYGNHKTDATEFYNVSICDERYRPSNKPTIIKINK